MAVECGFPTIQQVGTGFAIYLSKDSITYFGEPS
jgi:hypothetical protein